jgi:SNF2 family DNA or RNA helicase
MFDTIVINESHTIRNDASEVNLAIKWLSGDFHVMLSAKPHPE